MIIKNVTYILNKGSMKPDLHKTSAHVSDICRANNITLVPTWLPRSENWYADMLSKFYCDSDDWSISVDLFNFINKKWGTFDVDLFATAHNAKCNVFYSKAECKYCMSCFLNLIVIVFVMLWVVDGHWEDRLE